MVMACVDRLVSVSSGRHTIERDYQSSNGWSHFSSVRPFLVFHSSLPKNLSSLLFAGSCHSTTSTNWLYFSLKFSCIPVLMWSFRSISGAFPKVASSWQRAVATTTVRCQPYGNGLKSYPQYNVFGENCMLCMKLLPPVFKYLRNHQTLTLDSNKKGRILLEWIPRNPDGA